MPKYKTGLILLTSVFALCLGDVAFSKKHSGGFRESRDSQVETFDIITVEQAKNSKDDTFVVLQGYIDKSLGGEKYLFRDTTGTIKHQKNNKNFFFFFLEKSPMGEPLGILFIVFRRKLVLPLLYPATFAILVCRVRWMDYEEGMPDGILASFLHHLDRQTICRGFWLFPRCCLESLMQPIPHRKAKLFLV